MDIFAAANPSSHLSFTDVATWITWAAAGLYVVEKLGLLRRVLPKWQRWLRSRLPAVVAQLFRLPRSPTVSFVLGFLLIALSTVLFFVAGHLKVVLIIVAAIAAVMALLVQWWRETQGEELDERPPLRFGPSSLEPFPAARVAAQTLVREELAKEKEKEKRSHAAVESLARAIVHERQEGSGPVSRSIAPDTRSRIADVMMDAAKNVEREKDKQTVDAVLKRGSALRVATEDRQDSDELRRRYQPMAASISNAARIAAGMFGPTEVNQWLEDVARFVRTRFAEYSDRIVQRGLGTSTTEQIVEAIDQNFVVLRLIKSELESS